MTRKKKGINVFRIVIVLLLLVVVAVTLILVFKNAFNLEKKEEVDTTVKTEEEVNETVKISLEDYDVYFDDDKLEFNFIIAKLSFESNTTNLYYDLDYLTTSEKIKLGQCDYYLGKIKALNYDISSFNLLDTQFTSDTGRVTGNVFIPFLKNYNEICIYNGEVIKFDLTENKHNINELFYDVQTEDIKTDKYDIAVSNSYTENTFITSDTGDEFPVPLALVFELHINELASPNVYVEEAKFIPDGALSGFSIGMLDDHIDSYKIKNIINKKLQVGDNFGLFFQISEQTNTKGKIMIKFSDSDNWIEVSED